MKLVHDRVAAAARDQPAVDGERGEERDHEREGETPPEERVAESGGESARHDEDEGVVDDLHRRDRQRVGGEREAGGAPPGHVRAENRPERERVAEDERERDGDRNRRGVSPAEAGRDDHPEHLADRTAGEAVGGRLERRSVQRDGVPGVLVVSRHPTFILASGAPLAVPRCGYPHQETQASPISVGGARGEAGAYPPTYSSGEER